MDDYIVKPFDPQTLVGSILRQLRPGGRKLRLRPDWVPKAYAQVSTDWQDIEGIDSTDARARLSDDFDLFRSMLKRLLEEFSNISTPTAADDGAALAVHKGRMHKLRGSAGMLGARAIQQLAGEAEAACAAGEIDKAAHLATILRTHLQQLASSAAPLLAAARAKGAEAALRIGGEFHPEDLTNLLRQLRQKSLSAMDHFSAISPQLRRVLSKDSFEQVHGHIENLQFDDAVRVLEACHLENS
jgi:HPt (histidine-containing phosphotransfer) domain-containing protein